MEIRKKYVVYELNDIIGNEKYKALEKVFFDGWVHNSFDTEDAAIEALINHERIWDKYIILKEVTIDRY